MNYNHPIKNNSTIGIRLMCAIVFLLFTFVWLYIFQPDIMVAAQHVLSKGQTHYEPLVGAVLITVSLWLLQLLVYAIFRLKKRSHALTFLPSMLILAVITDVSQDIDLAFSWGAWLWAFPLIIVLWIGLMFLLRGLQQIEPDGEECGVFSRPMWINMLTMLALIICVSSVSNTNAVFHYRMKAENLLAKGDNDGALNVGIRSLESDVNLQMIRMYALSRNGELGERLFTYPIVGRSTAMLPTNGESRFIIYPVDSLYRYLGARPAKAMAPMRYLQIMEQRDSVVSRRHVDYELCGLLIDKQLDDFVRQLSHYYSNADTLDASSLPKHYREALILYTHLRSKPAVVYHDAVMDEDYQNMQDLERQYADRNERKGKVEVMFRGTYWYYYAYE